MIILFDVVIFAYGAYAIYAAIRLKKKQELTSFFTGGDNSPVRDKRGHIEAVYGKTILMGAVAAVYGGVGFVNDYFTPVPVIMKALMLLFLTAIVWFAISIRRAKRQYW